jgi:hypothetical protein
VRQYTAFVYSVAVGSGISISELQQGTLNLEYFLQQTPAIGNRAAVWGDHSNEDVTQISNAIYDEIVFWKKNLFKLPSGAAGKNYIKETTRLLSIWNEDSGMKESAIKFVMIMPALLLQKPCRKSNAKQHSEYLQKRMILWEDGKFDELLREARAIQQKLKQSTSKYDTNEHLAKTFAKLMLQGKVHAALRLLDKEAAGGVLNLNENTLNDLKKLHPEAKEAVETSSSSSSNHLF